MNALLTDSYDDRRTSQRIELLGEINGRVMPFKLPVVLLDLSPGGFALASPVPFVRHAEYTFQFNGKRPHGPIRAKDVHCLRVSHGTTDASYVAGFSFVLDGPEDQALVDGLIDEAEELMFAGSVRVGSH
ncbi:MAG TPA: PilZ domain-containing protein [Vicinamibacterales bacterium]|nr:PilZ domain-containing protein [Vicinamibacterales bacterium]